MCAIRSVILLFLINIGAFDVASSNAAGKSSRMLQIATPDEMNAANIIRSFGYPAEIHEVETEDGYLLTVHRIPYGRSGKIAGEKRPIAYLQHGILAASEQWLLKGANRDLAYILADNGYDVWMANQRGSTHSRKHIYLDPDKDKEFWNFSFHEIGYYDLPATIDYILGITNQTGVMYLGHSMGTTVFFVMASMRPEYNAKIKIMHGLSPAAGYPLLQQSITYTCTKEVAESERMYEILPFKAENTNLMRTVCSINAPFRSLCITMAYWVVGFGNELSEPMFTEYLKYFPAGTSMYTAQHYYYNCVNGAFAMRDFGEEKNMLIYNQAIPPDYPLNKITSPVFLYYAEGDGIISPADVKATSKAVPSVIEVFKAPYMFFNHADFITNSEKTLSLYDHILETTKNYL